MLRTIEINDSLEDHVNTAIEEVKEMLLNYLNENSPDNLPCLYNDLDYDGSFHEIVDGNVPIYTHEIKVAWFLHSDELEEAYKNAGVGNNPLENDGMAAIYFYIEQQVSEWYQDNAEEVFEEWQKGKLHYIAGAGLHGCMYATCQSFESVEEAAEYLADTHELSKGQRHYLQHFMTIELNLKKHGNEYAEIVECDCGNSESHNDN